MQRTACVSAVVWCALVAGVWSQQEEKPGEARLAVVKGNNDFSTKLYKVVDKENGNVFFSPLSIEVVLALTWLGAGGRTAKQIAEGLNLPASSQQVEEGFRELMTHLKRTNGNVTLDIANKVFAQQGYDLRREFHKAAEDNFLAEAQEVNFERNTEAARTTINQWVEEKTHNRIKDLLAKGTVDSSTTLVLANAIYFKGKWLKPFNQTLTQERDFHVNSTFIEDVQTMRSRGVYRYAELPELNSKVIQLQYTGEELSMLVLLPNDIDGLAQLESKLHSVDMNSVASSLRFREVILSLPKFKLESTLDLNEVLKQLGMTDMFGISADFSGLSSRNLKVSKVVQKSFVEVTEEGSEAAAATGVVGVTFSGAVTPPSPPAEFTADHPFIFFIRENSSGAILFTGLFSNPQ